MILKVLPSVLLLLKLSLVNCQWYGGYDSQYAQQYVIINPYSGYDDVYSQYPYDPQYYGGYAPYNQYSAQPIVIVVNNERDIDCDIDDFLSLLFLEDKCKEPVYVPYPVPVVVEHERSECGCKKECSCRCECSQCDKCRCNDCQNKKKKERSQKKCKCNESQKSSCSCGGLYHKML